MLAARPQTEKHGSGSWLPFPDVFQADPPKFCLGISVVPEDGGLVVKSLSPNSASRGILKPNDVVHSVDGVLVGTTEQLRACLTAGLDGTNLTVRFRRGPKPMIGGSEGGSRDPARATWSPLPPREEGGEGEAVLARDSRASVWELVQRTNELQAKLDDANSKLSSQTDAEHRVAVLEE
eukprot:CAMPEP_0114169818 /NCGR_PEP_ID=MMETSP0043_2-20121206/33779_1 /TAXON_ID=464988 /ORGANISM="Hemiselmis andersenii, Strain CCMP644" /LENGTH=178 /DNA_ID=CAMNT_0001267321 /DNA_START=1 /DNA_END=535 /DNA_ORIENTATION=+